MTLYRAVWNEDLAEVKRLLAAGADVNAKTADKFGDTPLHVASQEGYLDIARLLLDNGAEIDGQDEDGM